MHTIYNLIFWIPLLGEYSETSVTLAQTEKNLPNEGSKYMRNARDGRTPKIWLIFHGKFLHEDVKI